MASERRDEHLQSVNRLAVLLMAGAILSLSGCISSSVNLFEEESYATTPPGSVIQRAGRPDYVCATNGVWLRRDALDMLLGKKTGKRFK